MVFTYFWYYTVGEWTSSRFSAAVSDFSCESDSESWEALLYTDVSSQTAALMLLLLLLLLFSYRSQFYWDRLRQQNRFALPHLSFSESVSLDQILTKTETKYFDSIVLDSNSLSFLINCLLITELITQLPKFCCWHFCKTLNQFWSSQLFKNVSAKTHNSVCVNWLSVVNRVPVNNYADNSNLRLTMWWFIANGWSAAQLSKRKWLIEKIPKWRLLLTVLVSSDALYSKTLW